MFRHYCWQKRMHRRKFRRCTVKKVKVLPKVIVKGIRGPQGSQGPQGPQGVPESRKIIRRLNAQNESVDMDFNPLYT